MKVEGVSRITFEDHAFVYEGQRYPFDSIVATTFNAVETSHSTYGMKTGTSYTAELKVRSANGSVVHVKPDKSLVGIIKQSGFEGLARVAAIVDELSFNFRVAPYEQSFASRNYFSYGDYQFHKSGDVFEAGRKVASLRDPDSTLGLDYRHLTFVRKKDLVRRIGAAFYNTDVTIEARENRDCLVYMLHHHLGLSWKNEKVRTKRIDRKRVYFEAVLRIGALVASADGSPGRAELMQLKRFFSIEKEGIEDAAKLFNEQILHKKSAAQILQEFRAVFSTAVELKESFLLGIISVAIVDGHLHRAELDAINEVRHVLELNRRDFARVLSTAGLNYDELFGYKKSEGKGSTSSTSSPTGSTDHAVLGVSANATKEEIKAAYRNMVKRHHPDALRGQGLPENEIYKSEQVLRRIIAAYERLR